MRQTTVNRIALAIVLSHTATHGGGPILLAKPKEEKNSHDSDKLAKAEEKRK